LKSSQGWLSFQPWGASSQTDWWFQTNQANHQFEKMKKKTKQGCITLHSGREEHVQAVLLKISIYWSYFTSQMLKELRFGDKSTTQATTKLTK